MDQITLWACIDCYMGAHGILEDADTIATYADTVARVARDNAPLTIDITPGGACEQWEDEEHVGNCECNSVAFSYSPCELCLSSLGGTRHAVTLFVA